MVITETKTITNKYKVVDVTYPIPFSKYGDCKKRADKLNHSLEKRKLSKCFACKKQFKDEENVYLAIIKTEGGLGIKNKFLCEECASKVGG